MYIENTLSKYIEDLSGKLPTPGGGSAAALSGALGVALISMVLHYTIGKEKYEKFHDQLTQALHAAKELKHRFSQLIDEDVQVYKKLSETFKSKDGTIKEKVLKDAVVIPIEICNHSYEALKLAESILKKSNINLISDIGVAAELLVAAYNSALFNVHINLKSIKDEEFSSNIIKVITPQKEEMKKIKKTIIDFTNKALH